MGDPAVDAEALPALSEDQAAEEPADDDGLTVTAGEFTERGEAITAEDRALSEQAAAEHEPVVVPSAASEWLLAPLRNVGAIAGKELRSYFTSPIAYVVIAMFLLVNAYLFDFFLFTSRQANMDVAFGDMAIILLFIAPALTMRLLAEEQRTGTLELLLTAPVRDAEVVIGKFLASVVLLIVTLALTSPYALFLFKYGNPDRGPILSGYLGIFLLGCAFLAAGLFASSLTQNQIIAFMVGFAILLVLWLTDLAASSLSTTGANLVNYIAMRPHLDNFTRGLIQAKDVVYYLSVTVVALFLSAQSLETRRWR